MNKIAEAFHVNSLDAPVLVVPAHVRELPFQVFYWMLFITTPYVSGSVIAWMSITLSGMAVAPSA
jgi:hypothetical protein